MLNFYKVISIKQSIYKDCIGMLRVYVDMDYILCDFDTAYRRSKSNFSEIAYPHSQPDFFVGLKPLSSPLATFNWLNDKEHFDLSVLTAP